MCAYQKIFDQDISLYTQNELRVPTIERNSIINALDSAFRIPDVIDGAIEEMGDE